MNPQPERAHRTEPQALNGGAPTHKDVCSLFVTYRPNLEEFRDALRRASDGSRHIVVVDNSTDPRTQAAVKSVVEEVSEQWRNAGGHTNLHLLAYGENRGLSKAYNLGITKGRELGARFILLLDQDSLLAPGSICTLVEKWTQLGQHYRVGAISCKNVEEVTVSVGLEPVMNKLAAYRDRGAESRGALVREGSVREVKVFTNSGTMIPLECWEKTGPFNVSLFLDAVDYDYSMRLRMKGFKLFAAEDAVLKHRQGRYFNRKFLGFKLNLRSYSPLRSYWIVRDTLVFASLWFRRFPGEVVNILLRQMSGTFGAVWLLGDRRERGRLVLRAFSDFGHGKDPASAPWVPQEPKLEA